MHVGSSLLYGCLARVLNKVKRLMSFGAIEELAERFMALLRL